MHRGWGIMDAQINRINFDWFLSTWASQVLLTDVRSMFLFFHDAGTEAEGCAGSCPSLLALAKGWTFGKSGATSFPELQKRDLSIRITHVFQVLLCLIHLPKPSW